jgi:hypothetical protein
MKTTWKIMSKYRTMMRSMMINDDSTRRWMRRSSHRAGNQRMYEAQRARKMTPTHGQEIYRTKNAVKIARSRTIVE